MVQTSSPLLFPVTRVINTSGELGGHGGEVARKTSLIQHEKGVLDEKDREN